MRRCKGNYWFHGDAVISCTKDGKWSGSGQCVPCKMHVLIYTTWCYIEKGFHFVSNCALSFYRPKIRMIKLQLRNIRCDDTTNNNDLYTFFK